MASLEKAGSDAATRQEAEQLQRQTEAKVAPIELARTLASQHYCPTLSRRSSQ